MSALPVSFRSCPVTEEPAAGLVRAMAVEIAEIYDGLVIDGPDMPKAGPGELGPPGGDFLVGWLDGEAVCGGGIKRLSDEACEIKRMFVTPTARGRGVAGALLVALEDRARAMGYRLARLDTGPRQPRSQGMYERAGYTRIENFNANPMATFFGEKQLG